jgi:hypothetical protein
MHLIPPLLATLVLAGCLHSASEQSPPTTNSEPASGRVTVAEGTRPIGVPYVAGNRIYGITGDEADEELAAAANTLLIGTLAPAAVPEPGSEAAVAYNSWRKDRPVIRLRNLDRDEEAILDVGAYSVAWRRDGALAYFKALEPKLDTKNIKRYLGHVVVRASRAAPPRRWTARAGRYVVAAWAGERLLAYRLGESWPDLLVLDGRGRERVLARAAALVAVSPDGEEAFVSAYGATPPVVRVLDLADGEELGRLEVRAAPPRSEAVRWIVEAGSWTGDLVVAESNVGLLVFGVSGNDIVLEQALAFSRFPLGVFEPHLVDDRTIVAWGQLEQLPRQAVPDAVALQCNRFTRRCVQGERVSSANGPRLVYNPSRP